MSGSIDVNYYAPLSFPKRGLPPHDRASLLNYERTISTFQKDMKYYEDKIEERSMELQFLQQIDFGEDIYIPHIQNLKKELHKMQHVYLKLMTLLSGFLIPLNEEKLEELKEIKEDDMTEEEILKKKELEDDLQSMKDYTLQFKRLMVEHAIAHSITRDVSDEAVAEYGEILDPPRSYRNLRLS